MKAEYMDKDNIVHNFRDELQKEPTCHSQLCMINDAYDKMHSVIVIWMPWCVCILKET